MSKVRVTVSVSEDVAAYLRSSSNASAIVSEAVKAYRSEKLARELAAAYREDAEEAERLNREWERADAEIRE
jgi:hypothetical protein